MLDFDRGPSAAIAKILAEAPDPPNKAHFWFDWGPVFYRGRLDGSARLLCIASDPGATERIAGRTLIGDAGQLVQGFLAKLGLTHSYACLNAWPYALIPEFSLEEQDELAKPAQAGWRNRLYGAVVGAKLQAIVAFGGNAKRAVSAWTGRPGVPLVEVPHPSAHEEAVTVTKWTAAIDQLRGIVTPDEGGDNSGPNYSGSAFRESDYAPIPRHDLPFGAPAFLGDDAWLRAGPGKERSSVSRPYPDDRHTLIWHAPKATG